MRMYLFGATFVTTLLCLPTGAAAQGCADYSRHTVPATQPMACCQSDCCHDHDASVTALGLQEPALTKELIVTFRDPVKVGAVVLMGRYVIEHDDARMARGEPCTQIYDAERRLPVVSFHCTHLERATAATPTVVLRASPDSPIKVLSEFQYAGEAASHGVPASLR